MTTLEVETRRDSPRSKRGRILEVAIEQFGQVGYEHTKWAAVADEVGIGQTALYHYFESKGHCLLTIMRLELSDSVARFDRSTSGLTDPPTALRAAVSGSLQATPLDALQRRILQNHMDILASPRQSEKEEAERLRSRDLVGEIESRWSAVIRRGMDSGAFVRGDPQVYARLVLGVVVGVWRWYRPSGSLTLEQIIDLVSDTAVRMVRA